MIRTFILLLLPSVLHAQTVCSTHQLKIGAAREVVLADLRQRDCNLKIGLPEEGLEDDLVLPRKDNDYAYHELIFIDGKLRSVWSYSSWFTSAEMLFTALYRELATHSVLEPTSDPKDVLGQRKIHGRMFLQRPILDELGDKIGFDVENGSIFLESKKDNGGRTTVRVAAVRNR